MTTSSFIRNRFSVFWCLVTSLLAVLVIDSTHCPVANACQVDALGGRVKEAKVLPQRVFVYGSRAKKLTLDELVKLTAPASIAVKEGKGDDWTKVVIRWGQGSIEIDHNADREFLTPHLDGLNGYIFQRLAEERMDANVFHLIRQVSRTANTYGVSASDKTIQGLQAEFLTRLARSQNGVVFDGTGLLDPDLQILLGPKKQRDKLAKLPTFQSALDRKSRTMIELAKRNLKLLAELPSIVAEEELQIRSAEDVALRCMCLLAVAAHSEDADVIEPIEFLKQHGAWDAASPEEQAFLQNETASVEEKSKLTWRYESLMVLLWSIGKLDTITFPDAQADAATLITAVMRNTKDFVGTAKLRSSKDILDHADVVYRSYWLVRNGLVNQQPVEGLNGSVVYERHYALSWLVRYLNKDWDEVTPDS